MSPTRRLAAALALAVLSGPGAASAQDLSRYRDFALDSSLAAVLATSGAMPLSVKTLHERPARVQQLEWFAPYGGGAGGQLSDPVRSILFSFVDDRLYQLVVTYDRARTEGLTDADLVEPLSATYGTALLMDRTTAAAADARVDATVAARWRDGDAGVVLYRGLYGREYQLVVTGTSRAAEARIARAESIRLEAADAPRRARELLQQQGDDERAAKDKARLANKAAFKP